MRTATHTRIATPRTTYPPIRPRLCPPVVAALVGLAEPWQAAQVWARLGHVTALAPDEPFDPAEIEIEAVELTVEAINPQGGRRMFTIADYPEFTITSLAAVAFFKHFTIPNK